MRLPVVRTLTNHSPLLKQSIEQALSSISQAEELQPRLALSQLPAARHNSSCLQPQYGKPGPIRQHASTVQHEGTVRATRDYV